MIGSYCLDLPYIMHLCSGATFAVAVVPGAAGCRERKEYCRCRISTSKVTVEHNCSLF
jgi:hypothetical protein